MNDVGDLTTAVMGKENLGCRKKKTKSSLPYYGMKLVAIVKSEREGEKITKQKAEIIFISVDFWMQKVEY